MYLQKIRFFRLVSTAVLRQRCIHSIRPVSSNFFTRMQNDFELKRVLANPHVMSQVRDYAKKSQGKMAKGGVKHKSVHLTDEEMSEVIDLELYRTELHHIKDKLMKEFAEHLTLRSAASHIDSLVVKLEGEEYPLHELAQISKKNQNLIALNMSEFPEALKPAIQAIMESGSGLNPQQEGTMIYLSVPKLTREHRENLSKNAKSLFIRAKDEIRSLQNSFVREAKKQTDLSEDLVFNASNQIMTMAEETAVELEKIMKTKQKELLGDG